MSSRIASIVFCTLVAAAAFAGEPTTKPKSEAKPQDAKQDAKADELKAIKSTTPGAPTPELLLKKSADAWSRFDSKRFMSCLDQSDSDLRVMAKGWGLILDTMAARDELKNAMQDRYGKDAPEPEEIIGTHRPKLAFELIEQLSEHPDLVDKLKIEIDKDRAIAKMPGGGWGRLEMIKQKDVWVIDDTRHTMAAKSNEEGVTNMLILCRGLLDTYRAARPLVNDCRTLDAFKPRFRSLATRTMASTHEELKKRREAEDRFDRREDRREDRRK